MSVNQIMKVTQQPLCHGSQSNIQQSQLDWLARVKVTGQGYLHSDALEAPCMKGR